MSSFDCCVNIFQILEYAHTHCVREKKRLRNEANLQQKLHEAEYSNLPRPYDKKAKSHLAPAHKFEVSLEPDSFTEEK